jgi:hypothetical protein
MRLRVLGPRQRVAVRSAKITLKSSTSCRALRRARQAASGRGELLISGTDRFGHAVSYRRTIRLIGADPIRVT